MKKQVHIPFRFLLDELDALNPTVKPMFGCFGIYIGEKIVCSVRSKETQTQDNGIWVSTRAQHHESLRKIFPSMRSIQVLGNGETNWQIIPEEADDFEEEAFKLCSLIAKGDERIGNIPKPKKKKVRTS